MKFIILCSCIALAILSISTLIGSVDAVPRTTTSTTIRPRIMVRIPLNRLGPLGRPPAAGA
uniref:Venom peptide n=1 Tax=Dasymutilla sicheliana TaxID=1175388 RepID=A0A8T9VQR3_DASSI|nr:venom peptide precursor [Dasymutilla sicheliana]